MTTEDAQMVPAPLGPVERVVRPGAEARWYCLSRDGLATLCADEEDAQEVAAESWLSWPNNGPYRVAQMVDAGQMAAAVAAERERCLHLARYALSCAKNTEWSAAEDALDRIEGPNARLTGPKRPEQEYANGTE